MKDVAEHAGVSAMTVSLVLRGGAASARISADTRRRVLDSAKALEYQPNALGRALRSGVTNIIGLYAGYGYVNVRLPFFTEIVSGLQEGCEQVKKDLLLHGVFHGATPEDVFNELADGRIDGLIVNMPPDNPLARRLAGSNLPAVAVADPLPNIPSVVVNDAEGARLLVDYLASRGHHRVMYRGSSVGAISAVRRRQAFVEAAAACGMEIEEFGVDGGLHRDHPGVDDLLQRAPGQRPTAAACWSDTSAYEMVAHCRRQGIRVPEDMAIVSFDGCATPFDNVWSLTTIRAPWARVARTAVLYLDSLLKGETVPHETILPVEFVPGHTA